MKLRAFVPIFPSAMHVQALLPANTQLAGILVKALMGHQTASSLAVIGLYPSHHDVLPTKCSSMVNFSASSSWSSQACLLSSWHSQRNVFCMVANDPITSFSWEILTLLSHSAVFRLMGLSSSLPHLSSTFFPGSPWSSALQSSIFSIPILLRVSQRSWSDLGPNAIFHRNNAHYIKLVSKSLAGSQCC